MINANELRIGNWIYKTEFGSDKEEKKLYIIKYPHMDFTFTKAYFPIPLTPEILVKAGFEKTSDEDDEDMCFEKEGFNSLADYGTQQIVIENKTGLVYLECGYYQNRIYIDSLHKLQNCFQILTGEELDIKM